MKKNWKTTVSVLLLAALLCALPGTLAWGTDIDAIQPNGPSGIQTGEIGSGDSTGTGTSAGESGGSGSSTSTETGGDSGTGSGSSTEPGSTSGSGSGGSTTETGSTTGGDSGGSGSGSSNETGGTSGGESGGSTTETGSTTGGDSGGSGSGSSAEATPTTTPEATPSPSPSTTPTPTPTPSLPVITKDPTDETVDVNGDCWFIANCNNSLNAVWHFVSPNGKTNYRSNDQAVPTAFPGLIIEISGNGNQSNLHLSSIPAQMNGWGAYCEYSNNTGSVRTSAAVVHVNGASSVTPSPSPSATPTAKPSPSPTPSATPTVTPSPSPAATQIPVVSPTPEGTQEPPTALNRGGKIFLLFGAVALVVGAAAIGTILLVSKRMSAKEAYTYKSGSRRRK